MMHILYCGFNISLTAYKLLIDKSTNLLHRWLLWYNMTNPQIIPTEYKASLSLKKDLVVTNRIVHKTSTEQFIAKKHVRLNHKLFSNSIWAIPHILCRIDVKLLYTSKHIYPTQLRICKIHKVKVSLILFVYS